MVRGGWVFRGAKGTDIDNGPLKCSSCLIFFHFVGRGGKDARDAARASPGNDVVGAASSSKKLRVCGRYVNFYSIVEGKSLGGAMLIQSFLGCAGHKGFVRRSKRMESVDGFTESVDERHR